MIRQTLGWPSGHAYSDIGHCVERFSVLCDGVPLHKALEIAIGKNWGLVGASPRTRLGNTSVDVSAVPSPLQPRLDQPPHPAAPSADARMILRTSRTPSVKCFRALASSTP